MYLFLHFSDINAKCYNAAKYLETRTKYWDKLTVSISHQYHSYNYVCDVHSSICKFLYHMQY